MHGPLQWAWGQGTKMLRLGYAKPGSWASFWAILTLVGLATHAGEWAVGRERGQDLPALAAHSQKGAMCSRPGPAESAGWRRAACLRGLEGWEGGQAGRGQNDQKIFPRSIVLGSWPRPSRVGCCADPSK